jgi:hypothetical protein
MESKALCHLIIKKNKKLNASIMKPDFTLSVSKPCAANWNEMTPNEQGKFCSHCGLTVVDFTQMNETEVKEYFRYHYGQKTCGRFETSQLSNPESSIQQHWTSLINNVEIYLRKSHLRTATLSFLTILAFLVGCRKPTARTPMMGKIKIMGEPSFHIEKVDSVNTTTPTLENSIK